MSTRAAATQDDSTPKAAPAIDSPLLDVLPQHPGTAGDVAQSLAFALPADVAVALHDDDVARRALVAALASVDGWLSGADEIVATMRCADGWKQSRISIASTGTAAFNAAIDSLEVGHAPQPCVWAVADDAGVMPDFAASTWRIEGAKLHATFRDPLSAEAARLIGDAVVRSLPAISSGNALALSRIDALDPADRTRQVDDWAVAPPARTTFKTVHACFAQTLASWPDKAAVVHGDASITYAELDRRAASLATRLREAGAAPGDVVGVALPRSLDAVVALLGVIKAGGAYLPLDLALPSDRLAFMVENANVRVIVVDPALHVSALPREPKRVNVHGDDAPFEDDPGTDDESLAYVIFTSGSTGVPKGVEIRHRSLVRRLHGIDYVTLDTDTRMLHQAPLGFDISGLELWGALFNGGTIVVHDEVAPTAARLRETISRHDANAAIMAAALFNAVVDEDATIFGSMRDLIAGGEALSVDHIRRMQAIAPQLQLHNGYGPTECTIMCTSYAIPRDLPADAASVPIGRAMQDTSAYVLNRRLQLLPAGVIGELCIGGAGVARGYVARPELNAERFVPNPYLEGDVLYRTGDQVRLREDGLIEFVGRTDGQVKIRGHRIELTEIEAVLARHPAIASCVVVARADFPGEKRLVAYYVGTGVEAHAPQLRAHLAAALPAYMVPTRYVHLDELPLTANAKIDRRALPAPDRRRPELTVDFAAPVTTLEARLCDAIGALLDIEGVGREDNFFELGGSSLLAVRLAEQIRAEGWQSDETGPRVVAPTIFQNPTPARLAAVLEGVKASHAPTRRTVDAREPIAIVAMAGRFPGADDVEGFWNNLCEGRDSITKFRIDELDPAVNAADRNDPGYVAARGVIDNVELFDAGFFGIGPREAELMDPQQRIFLELCWECLERGGHAPDAAGVTGIFAGMNNATYFQRHVGAHPELVSRVGALQVMLGNEKDYIATRVAHKLNLTGPAVSVHTACSTSLVAIAQAVESLQAGLCDMALAGGIAVTCPPRSGYLYQEGSMLSPDGHTRTFDADAKGTVFGDGAAVVLLKRLSDAIADGNPVYAVIRGSALNNDGANRASFTAPSSEGQAAVIALAHDKAGVDARSITYVEAHGTATPLGDPIEIEGLTRAFRRGTQDSGFCRIGSLKSNVGHMVTAAGAAGVIKTALSLHEKRIPASIHFESPNPTIDFASTPFVVNARMSAWDRDGDAPRRAGVSSFGLGGTNAHAVLEEAPPMPESDKARGPQLLVLSARTPTALAAATNRLADHLDAHRDANLADVAWTLAVGRKAFTHRIAIAADDVASTIETLRAPDALAEAARSRPARAAGVVFMFPGQGATYPGMGRSLHESEPVFRDALDECAELLRSDLGLDLLERLFSDDAESLLPTSIMQPATFAIEYALAKWWMSRGIEPATMIGHSIGEFVAATLAGVFELRDALHLIARRGALMQAQPAGSMLSIRLPADAVRERLPQTLSLAAENSPLACVVAGESDTVAAFQAQLEAEGIACRALRTSHAFHSAMMEPVVAPFRDAVAAVRLNPPTRSIVSTVTGALLGADEATSPDYWARHLREGVRFSSALQALLDSDEAASRVLLEVGPRGTLNALARQQPVVQKQRIATVASLADNPASERRDLLGAAGKLWSQGAAIAPAAFDTRAIRHRLRLPTYPFERQQIGRASCRERV